MTKRIPHWTPDRKWKAGDVAILPAITDRNSLRLALKLHRACEFWQRRVLGLPMDDVEEIAYALLADTQDCWVFSWVLAKRLGQRTVHAIDKEIRTRAGRAVLRRKYLDPIMAWNARIEEHRKLLPEVYSRYIAAVAGPVKAVLFRPDLGGPSWWEARDV